MRTFFGGEGSPPFPEKEVPRVRHAAPRDRRRRSPPLSPALPDPRRRRRAVRDPEARHALETGGRLVRHAVASPDLLLRRPRRRLPLLRRLPPRPALAG